MLHLNEAMYFEIVDYVHKATQEELSKLALLLAKKKPAIFLEMVNDGVAPYEKVARTMVAEGDIIPAIRHIREITGMTLREAKEIVDGYRNEINI